MTAEGAGDPSTTESTGASPDDVASDSTQTGPTTTNDPAVVKPTLEVSQEEGSAISPEEGTSMTTPDGNSEEIHRTIDNGWDGDKAGEPDANASKKSMKRASCKLCIRLQLAGTG